MFGLYLALSEIAFDANGVTLGVLHKAVEKATYPGIEIELLSKVVYGLIMRRRDPGVLHLRI